MKAFREKQLKRNMARVAQLGEDIQSELWEKLSILEKAKEAGLISASEYCTKKADLYQSYSRTYLFKFEEFLIKKLSS